MIPENKTIECGLFTLYKGRRPMSKKQRKSLINANQISKEVMAELIKGVPYIMVVSLASDWCIQWTGISDMYKFLDSYELVNGELSPEDIERLSALFTLYYSETASLPDTDYLNKRIDILNEYIARMDEEDKEILNKEE